MLIQRNDLVDAIRILNLATSSDLANPAYSSVLIESAANDYILLSTTDGRLGARVAIKVPLGGQTFSQRIGIGPFTAAVRAASHEVVVLDLSKEGYATFECGSLKTKFATRQQYGAMSVVIDPEQRVTIADVPFGELSKSVSNVSWLTPQNPANPTFADVHLMARNGLVEAVASDTIALFMSPTTITEDAFSRVVDEETLDIALPPRFVSALERLGLKEDTTIRLYVDSSLNKIALSVPGKVELTSPLNVTKFPDYTKWINIQVMTISTLVNKKELLEALGQVNSILLADKVKSPTCLFTAQEGYFTLKAMGAVHEVETKLPMQQVLEEDIPAFCVDTQILARALRNISGDAITLLVPQTSNEPLFVHGTGLELFILMQKRLV